MTEGEVTVDVDEVRSVVAFYRHAAEVVGSASSSIRDHELGTWAAGEEYRELGERYRDMGRVITDRLGEQARAAAHLADVLDDGMSRLVGADAELGMEVRAGRHRGPADGSP